MMMIKGMAGLTLKSMPNQTVQQLHEGVFGKGHDVGAQDRADKAGHAAQDGGGKDREDRQPAHQRVDERVHAPQRAADTGQTAGQQPGQIVDSFDARCP